AMIVPASLSIVTNAFSGRDRVRAIALWGGASGLVSGLGPPVGGVLTEVAGWPSIFWATLVVVAVILAFAYPGVAESCDETAVRTIDYGGALFLAGAITTLSLTLIEGPSWGWLSTPTAVSFALAAALLAGLVLVERRSANPVVVLSMLRHRNFVGGMVVKLVVNFVLAGLLFMLPIYLQEILYYSPLEAGVLLLPLSGTFLLSLPLGGRLMENYGPRLPMVAGLLLATVGLLFIADVSPSTSYVDLWPPMLGLGFGVGLVLTPMNATAVNAVPVRQHGAATGVLTTVIGLGSVLGVAITAGVFRTLEDERLDHVLAKTGPRLPDSTERILEGVLVHAQNAEQELARFGPQAQGNIIAALREAFVFGISNALTVSVVVAAAGAFATLLILKRRPTARSSDC
ncbi:MAG: MFS transporter, partial [Actinobacteria bacterium]|nr:MFS transporter [Actinomycetota bacterium]